MLIFKQKILKFYSQFPFESFLNTLVSVVILSIVVLAFLQLSRPIQPEQLQNIVKLSQQAQYPDTQHMAKQLLQSEQIKCVEYFHLVRAERYEAQHTKKYPALNINNY